LRTLIKYDRTNEAVSTVQSIRMGTPTYMAPEQCNSDFSAMRIVSDVWAFGIMLFEALTGKRPLSGIRSLNANQIIERIKNVELPSPNDIQPATPKSFDRLCSQMLASATGQRMQDLTAFIGETERLLRQGHE